MRKSTHPAVLFDNRGILIEGNAALSDLLGYDVETLRGVALTDVVPPSELESRPPQFPELAVGATLELPRTLRHREGHPVEVFARVKRLSDDRFVAVLESLVRQNA
ncbi:MAG: PAS domain S-box protein [Deltaproteobacteria bacterium]|nr:PAS domain S-box protein [Deltaproteobacteria bacterium]